MAKKNRTNKAKKAGAARVVVVDGEAGARRLAHNMSKFADGLAPSASWDDVKLQAPGIVRHTVDEIVHLLAGHDTFDVLELLRLHELFYVPATTGEEGLAASFDVVALVVIGIGTRHPTTTSSTTDSNPDIPALSHLAHRITKLATMLGFAQRADPASGPFAELAGELRGSELMIRGKHYDSIAEQLNAGVLETEKTEKLLEASLGYTYRDIRRVRSAIRETYDGRKNALSNRIAEQFNLRNEDVEFSAEQTEALGSAVADLMLTPGKSSSFTVEDIAAASNIDPDRARRILDDFSIAIGEAGHDTVGLVSEFVEGRNLLYGIDLISDGCGNFLMLQNGIPVDHVRRRIESKLDSKSWAIYHKQRDIIFAEVFACGKVASLLGDAQHNSFEYYAPSLGRTTEDLTKAAQDPSRYGRVVEADALLVVDDVAICVEVKAGSVREKSRSGDVQTLGSDLRKTITEATSQADRLKHLILDNGGLWLKNRKWLDLSAIREVHTVVACLDDFGPLAVGADALVRAGVLHESSIPWIVSLHDLAVIAEILTQPASFLLYLRRRTEPMTARLVVALDELDVFMWFVKGGLYFEGDPVVIHERFPMSPPPLWNDIQRYKRQKPVRVHTLTDDLDIWMYSQERDSDFQAEKPARHEHPDIAKLVDFMERERKPGWLRFGADLLNLAGESQSHLGDGIREIIAATKADFRSHTLANTYLTPWGYAALFVGTQPPGGANAWDGLLQYAKAKKHQLKADRALVVMFDLQGSVTTIEYLNNLPEHDEALDRLGAEMRLRSPRDTGIARQHTNATPKRSARSGKRRRR